MSNFDDRFYRQSSKSAIELAILLQAFDLAVEQLAHHQFESFGIVRHQLLAQAKADSPDKTDDRSIVSSAFDLAIQALSDYRGISCEDQQAQLMLQAVMKLARLKNQG